MTVRSIGVEEEFLLLRRHGTRLAEDGAAVVDAATDGDDDVQFEHELKRAQAELASSPTRSLTTLAADLAALRGRLAQACAGRGIRLVAAGTSPVLEAARTTPDERYDDMTDRFGIVAEQQLACGMHVHVSVDAEREGVQVLAGIAPWLPVLTALSANSPFYAGRDTGYASYRSILWGQLPTSGSTEDFADLAEYEQLQQDLVTVGAARDTRMIYFAARLSPNYPTVEIRSCDVCAYPEDAAVLAGLARAMVEHAARHPRGRSARPEVLRAAQWRAARYGMSDRLVHVGEGVGLVPAWDLVDEVLETVATALDDGGEADLVRAGLARIRDRGTGADLQRSLHREHDDFAAVLDGLAVAPTTPR